MKRRRQEGGFALLLVFLMAAVIAISLYMEIPRVAFESQRQKEELLVDRGEQYKRAIQVFYTTNKRYPARIEELESLNGRRFLRRRYIDPMTGKDEWRLVHIQNGMLTDSVDTKQKKKDDKDSGGNSGQYVAELGGMGQTPTTPGQGAVSLANRRRSSEGGTAGGSTMPGTTGAPNGALPIPGMQPNSGVPGAPGQPGTPGSPPVPPGIPGVPGGTAPGQSNSSNSANNGSSIGGGAYMGGGYSMGSQPTTTPTTPAQTGPGGFAVGRGVANPAPTPGGLGLQQPGGNPQAQNAAAAMIQQILTQPRPGGMPTATAGAMGGGIAGVASKDDEDSIMVYNNHTNYSEWEYIFDFSKYRPPPNPLQGVAGTPAGQLGNMPGSPVGTPVGQPSASPFGQSSPSPFGQGSPSPFGQSPGTPNSSPTIPH